MEHLWEADRGATVERNSGQDISKIIGPTDPSKTGEFPGLDERPATIGDHFAGFRHSCVPDGSSHRPLRRLARV
jgi:hypothetical protein